LNGILNHRSISALIEESIDADHRRHGYPTENLNFHFSTDCGPEQRAPILTTNGRIIIIGYYGNEYYDIGYNFIELLTEH
jgi:hypothetical protein